MPETLRPGRYSSLDALRGLAAVVVFLFHCLIRNTGWEDHPLRLGVTGVDLFFMISGFVIFHSLSQTKSFWNFFRKRMKRLYPAYWAAVTFSACLIMIRSRGQIPENFISTYLGNLTMVQHLIGFANIDEQYWTLEVELLFYVIIGIVFAIGQLKNIEFISLICLLTIVLLQAIHLISTDPAGHLQHIVHAPLFITGILFYRMKTRGNSIFRMALIILALLTSVLVFQSGGKSRYYVTQWEYMCLVMAYSVIFHLAITNRLRFLNTRLLMFFGSISYSFYLIHQYLSSRIILPFLENKGLPNALATAAAFAVCTLLAWLLRRFVEQPAARQPEV